jgi:effector-binding domain-containing protein
MPRPRPVRRTAVTLASVLAMSLGSTAAAWAQTTPATPPATTETPAKSDAPAAPPATAPATPAPPTSTPAPAAPPAASAPAVPATPQVQTADPFGEEITLTSKQMLIFSGNATWDSAFETLMDAFKALTAFLDKQGIKPSGNPMIVYTSTDDNGFSFQAEFPVDQTPKNLGKNMSVGKSPEGKALKFVHRGSYDNMDNTYEAITNHLDDKKLEARDLFIEEYLTDPLKTEEDKLIINVYVPLK